MHGEPRGAPVRNARPRQLGGLYTVQPDGSLLLGPFQGKPACVRIARGRGVCGAACEAAETQLVPDVHAFPGHIACDSASRSELVVPVIRDGVVRAVLDIDSPIRNRFTERERALAEKLQIFWRRNSDRRI